MKLNGEDLELRTCPFFDVATKVLKHQIRFHFLCERYYRKKNYVIERLCLVLYRTSFDQLTISAHQQKA